MNEIMGGITRLTNKHEIDPNLLKTRLEEQREMEAGVEEKPKQEKTIRFSKLQWAILNLCVKNGRNHGSYTASVEDIIDSYYGKRSGLRRRKSVAVHRAIRTLDKKKIAQLMSGLVGRVELTPIAQKIAKEEAGK